MIHPTLQSPMPVSGSHSFAGSIPTAVAYVRKLRGGCQAHLLKADDGVSYVVKFVENPQGRRVLVNELIGSQLLSLLGVATPQATPIRITTEFLAAYPEVGIETKECRKPISAGLAFASPLPVYPETRTIFDFLPDKCLARVVNLPDFAGALLLDQWAGNSDARQCVFFQAKTNGTAADAGRRGWAAQMIDNGLLFEGEAWRLATSPISGIYWQHCVYAGIRSWRDFEPYLPQMLSINESCLQGVIDAVPVEWITQDRSAIADLMMRLLKRASRVPSLIDDVRRMRPECFPNWAVRTTVSLPYRVNTPAQNADARGYHSLSSRLRKPDLSAVSANPMITSHNVNYKIVS